MQMAQLAEHRPLLLSENCCILEQDVVNVNPGDMGPIVGFSFE